MKTDGHDKLQYELKVNSWRDGKELLVDQIYERWELEMNLDWSRSRKWDCSKNVRFIPSWMFYIEKNTWEMIELVIDFNDL